MTIHNKTGWCIAVPLLALVMAGCSDNDSTPVVTTPTPTPTPPVMVDYQIDITNMTLAQPLSPVAIVAHGEIYQAFELGQMATDGLEQLAEGGDNTAFLAEADMDSDVVTSASGDGAIGPGASASITVSVEEDNVTGLMLSAVSMLVNTNDAITASMSVSVENLAMGESISLVTRSYDAGTEANSEAAGTIPGPADGGEGFNADRDDIADAIRGHSGVVTAADGLTSSVLGESHRWDNPVARVTITRL